MLRGAALQCRITTEDPAQGFRPDTGKITTYRSPGGAGIRLDGGTVAAGAQVSPHFDSMLVKMTCRGARLPVGRARGHAAVSPSSACAASPRTSRSCRRCSTTRRSSPATSATSFIDERPELLTANPVEGPRHEDRHLARRDDRQPAERRGPRRHQPRGQAAGDRPARRPRRPGRASACSSSGPTASRRRCASRRRSPSPRRPSATPTSRCSRRGCAPATSSRCCRTSRA